MRNTWLKVKLTPETISTQIIPRDRHAVLFSTLSILASSIERLSVEIRHLQRTEVLEAEEYFSKGQKGSSAMPRIKEILFFQKTLLACLGILEILVTQV